MKLDLRQASPWQTAAAQEDAVRPNDSPAPACSFRPKARSPIHFTARSHPRQGRNKTGYPNPPLPNPALGRDPFLSPIATYPCRDNEKKGVTPGKSLVQLEAEADHGLCIDGRGVGGARAGSRAGRGPALHGGKDCAHRTRYHFGSMCTSIGDCVRVSEHFRSES